MPCAIVSSLASWEGVKLGQEYQMQSTPTFTSLSKSEVKEFLLPLKDVPH